MALTDKEKLKVYDQLRIAHSHIRPLRSFPMDEEEDRMAVEAVDYVLYLAEEHFAKMSE